MRIHVDWKLCDGNGICALEAPAHFDLDDDDELQLLDAEVGPAEEQSVRSAVTACPKHALALEGGAAGA